MGAGDGPAAEQDGVRVDLDAVRVHGRRCHQIGKHQHRRAGLARIGNLHHPRVQTEPDPRLPGHRHRRREGHAHLDPLARPVGRARPRRRRQRHRRHRRRRPHRDRDRVARAVANGGCVVGPAPALDREPVAQHPLLRERRRREARPRHVRRREALRPVRIRHLVAVGVDLDPPMVGIRPPRTPARAAQRRGLARVQDQVRAGVRQRQEAREPGVAVAGRAWSQLVSGSNTRSGRLPAARALSRRVRVSTASSPSNIPAGSALSALVFRFRVRHPAQACEVARLERLDALVSQLAARR